MRAAGGSPPPFWRISCPMELLLSSLGSLPVHFAIVTSRSSGCVIRHRTTNPPGVTLAARLATASA